MADLSETQTAQPVKLVGSDSTGLETYAVNADSSGNLKTTTPSVGPVIPGASASYSNLMGGQYNSSLPILTSTQQSAIQIDSSGRVIVSPLVNSSIVKSQLQDNAGTGIILGQNTMSASLPIAISSDQSKIPINGNVASGSSDTGYPVKMGGVYNSTLPVVSSGSRVDLQLDSSGRLLTSTAITTSLPSATFLSQHVVTNGSTVYTAFTATQKLAIKQFYAGGTGIGKQVLYSYLPNNTQLLNSGDFETSGDVANWPYFSSGGSGTGTVALSNAQAETGTHSESITFTTSDSNHSNGIKQTFISPLDISGWRYITAQFFNTLSAGATYTRTISIVITDSNSSTRKFDLSGISTSAPFNSSNWIKLTGEIVNPTSSTGLNFDVTSVVSVELRMVDSGTRAGTVYWDTARLEAQITPVFPIYHQANVSFNIAIDPVFIMNVSDQILIAQTNNDTSKQEYFASAGGVTV